MILDKAKITGSQFMFAITLFLQSSSLLTMFLGSISKQDSWITILIATLLCSPLIWIFRSLMVLFPEKNFMQMLEIVYGPILGKAIGVLYIWFFLTLSSINLRDLGVFSKITLMARTPHFVLIATAMIVAAAGVRCGMRVITRYSATFAIFQFALVAFSMILVASQMRLSNFMPIFDLPFIKYVQGTHVVATIPLGELVVFLMLAPNVRLSPSDTTKYWFLGVGMGILNLLAVMIRDIAVLGNLINIFTLPGLVSLRLVNLGEALARMESIFAVILIVLLFSKVMILYYASVLTVAQVSNVKNFRHLVLVIGAFIISYSMTLFPDPIAHGTAAQEVVPIVWTVFEIAIPVLTFIIAKIRDLSAPPNEKLQQAGESTS